MIWQKTTLKIKIFACRQQLLLFYMLQSRNKWQGRVVTTDCNSKNWQVEQHFLLVCRKFIKAKIFVSKNGIFTPTPGLWGVERVAKMWLILPAWWRAKWLKLGSDWRISRKIFWQHWSRSRCRHERRPLFTTSRFQRQGGKSKGISLIKGLRRWRLQ